MLDTIKIVLTVLLVLAAINFILYAAKNERVRVIEIEKDFIVRYPLVYRLICVVFFLLVLVLALNMLVWQQLQPVALMLTIVLGVLGCPFLLISLVWKIKVQEEYIIYVSMFGVKKQIYYKDISRAILTKSSLTLVTTLKIYHFSPNVVYREYFLKKLALNDVEIERY